MWDTVYTMQGKTCLILITVFVVLLPRNASRFNLLAVYEYNNLACFIYILFSDYCIVVHLNNAFLPLS